MTELSSKDKKADINIGIYSQEHIMYNDNI